MNRQQAENMLDAFIEIHNTYKRGTSASASVDKALESMREVILDAMTEYRTAYNPGITLTPWTTTNPPKPLVTCTDETPTMTTHGTVYANGHVQGVGE